MIVKETYIRQEVIDSLVAGTFEKDFLDAATNDLVGHDIIAEAESVIKEAAPEPELAATQSSTVEPDSREHIKPNRKLLNAAALSLSLFVTASPTITKTAESIFSRSHLKVEEKVIDNIELSKPTTPDAQETPEADPYSETIASLVPNETSEDQLNLLKFAVNFIPVQLDVNVINTPKEQLAAKRAEAQLTVLKNFMEAHKNDRERVGKFFAEFHYQQNQLKYIEAAQKHDKEAAYYWSLNRDQVNTGIQKSIDEGRLKFKEDEDAGLAAKVNEDWKHPNKMTDDAARFMLMVADNFNITVSAISSEHHCPSEHCDLRAFDISKFINGQQVERWDELMTFIYGHKEFLDQFISDPLPKGAYLLSDGKESNYPLKTIIAHRNHGHVSVKVSSQPPGMPAFSYSGLRASPDMPLFVGAIQPDQEPITGAEPAEKPTVEQPASETKDAQEKPTTTTTPAAEPSDSKPTGEKAKPPKLSEEEKTVVVDYLKVVEAKKSAETAKFLEKVADLNALTFDQGITDINAIHAYLDREIPADSPLKAIDSGQLAQQIVDAGRANNVNPALILATAHHESGLANPDMDAVSAQPPYYNLFGRTASESQPHTPPLGPSGHIWFISPSYMESIAQQANFVRSNYLNDSNVRDLPSYVHKYAPNGDYLNNELNYMRSLLGTYRALRTGQRDVPIE